MQFESVSEDETTLMKRHLDQQTSWSRDGQINKGRLTARRKSMSGFPSAGYFKFPCRFLGSTIARACRRPRKVSYVNRAFRIILLYYFREILNNTLALALSIIH